MRKSELLIRKLANSFGKRSCQQQAMLPLRFMKEMESNTLSLPAEVGRVPKVGMLTWLLPYRTNLWM
jgi:hypothetical protein